MISVPPSEKWDHILTATEVWRTVCHKLPCNQKNQRQRNLVYVKISVSLQIFCIEENKQKLHIDHAERMDELWRNHCTLISTFFHLKQRLT